MHAVQLILFHIPLEALTLSMDKALRIVAASVLTIIGVAIIAAIGSHASSNDYVEYWSAGQLFVHGANPYSGPAILALEKAQGFTPDSPLIMLNPPWALFMVAPLGFCAPRVGLILWVLIAAGAVLASLVVMKVPPDRRIIAFLFTPVLATFSMQQSSPLLLLGFALFLRFHRKHPFVAGASLFLLTIKPHLFLVFWLVLLADCLYRRRFSILAGLAAAMTCASGLATLVVPHVWQDYLALVRGSALAQNYFPTLPSLFRMMIDVRQPWLTLVPSFVAIVWGLAYYWVKRALWDWSRHGMPVMLVAILTSPYGWISDQVVILPSLATTLESSPRKYSMELLTAINVAALLAFCLRSQACAWLPLAWLAWYLFASRTITKNNLPGSGAEPEHREALVPSS
jgi:hypothetical protein